MKLQGIVLFALILLGAGCHLTDSDPGSERSYSVIESELTSETNSTTAGVLTEYVTIKFRDTEVNVAHDRFNYLDTSESSWIDGAWYDKTEGYMVINLNGTNYHHCGVDYLAWNRFESAGSFGSSYNALFKGSYDCRIFYVPSYPDDR